MTRTSAVSSHPPHVARLHGARRLLALGALLLATTAPAGQAQTIGQLFIEAQSDDGQPLMNLTPADFQILEDGIVTGILSAQPATQPMKIALLVDNGDRVQTAIPDLRRALTAFVDTIASSHEIGLFTISGPPRQRTDFTRDRGALRREINRLLLDPGATPRLFDGVGETWRRRFDNDPFPVFVLVLTDADDASGFVTPGAYQSLLQQLGGAGVTVHAVLLSTRGGGTVTSMADNLTRSTGGLMNTINLASGLDRALTALAGRLNAHYDRVSTWYNVHFERTDPPGSRVSVGVARSQARVNVFLNRAIVP